MKNDLTIITEIQKIVLAELNSNSDINSTQDIGLLSAKLDECLLTKIKEILLKEVSLFIKNSNFHIGDIFSILIAGKKHLLYVQQSLILPSQVEICIVNKDLDLLETKYVDANINLIQCGRLDKLLVSYPSYLTNSIDFATIKVICEAIIKTAYKWIELRASKIIGDNFIVSESIYNYLRNIINGELVNNIWLYASCKNCGMYIVDQKVIEKSLQLFQPLSIRTGYPPLKILSEMLNKRLPFHETGSYHVVQTNKTIDFELSKLSYSEKETLLTHAEIQVFGKDAVSAIPIESEGSFKLVAGVPVNLKSEIEPIIIAHQEQLRKEYNLINSRLARFNKIISNTKDKINTGMLGEFMGGMIKSFIT